MSDYNSISVSGVLSALNPFSDGQFLLPTGKTDAPSTLNRSVGDYVRDMFTGIPGVVTWATPLSQSEMETNAAVAAVGVAQAGGTQKQQQAAYNEVLTFEQTTGKPDVDIPGAIADAVDSLTPDWSSIAVAGIAVVGVVMALLLTVEALKR